MRRFRSFVAALSTVIVTALPLPARAQISAPPSIDPATLDVANVKLGMTQDQAIAALMAFDKNFWIEKDYEDQGVNISYGDEGRSYLDLNNVTDPTVLPEDKALFVHLYAIDPPCTEYQGETASGCLQGYQEQHSGYDVVDVWFSPVPGHEQVIAVRRMKVYGQGDAEPALATVESAALAKYPKEYTLQDLSQTHTVDWMFDSKNRFISEKRAQELQLSSNSGTLPGSVSAHDGIGLGISFNVDPDNPGLTHSFSVALFDSQGLYQFSDTVNAEFSQIMKQIQNAAVQNASKNAAAPNF